MPIYMDRHDIPKEVSAAHVAEMHQADLAVQHLFGCKGLTYWCDEERQAVFCLIDAPDRDAINRMHDHAHGAVPHHIIEVDARLVESFLGRISDPEPTDDGELLINDPALRVIMMVEASDFLSRANNAQFGIFDQNFHRTVSRIFKKFEGTVVRQNNTSYLLSFKSVTNAVLCALKIHESYKYISPKINSPLSRLKVGIDAGVPVTGTKEIFGDVVVTASRICEVVKEPLVVTTKIKSLYEKENRNARLDPKLIRTLKPREEHFLNQLMDFCEQILNDSSLNIKTFSRELGFSKSQLYRKLKGLTGKSPNNFLREQRLLKAVDLLQKHFGNISEVAFETGFNNPAYFTKCFADHFGLLPSTYVRQYAV